MQAALDVAVAQERKVSRFRKRLASRRAESLQAQLSGMKFEGGEQGQM